MVNRVVPDDQLLEKGMRFAAPAGRRADRWPTGRPSGSSAPTATGGVEEADEVTPDGSRSCSRSEDLQNAVQTFLEEGPGKATFEGR